MTELLTTKQVQELLKVDRITVYRMLKDGRLSGVKVGQQWRFKRQDIEALISPEQPSGDSRLSNPREILPVHCLQVIQDVFAEIIGVGSVTTDYNGDPITDISNSCHFCNTILSSPDGRVGCIESWRRLAQLPAVKPKFLECHAGLKYARARIEIKEETIGILVAGQFVSSLDDKESLGQHFEKIAAQYNINPTELIESLDSIRILDESRQEQIGEWLVRVADTFKDIALERAELLQRLKSIAAMSTFSD
jgi:excisionase family DNA binding protein